uniref:Small nuclear RNA activating complex polypeptide 2 n=1 Tax=Maylandia zebra TaxID=106582 RepID=A0A3P9BRW4_9CICH
MKPHPRVTRTKWADRLDAEPERSGKCSWHRDEKKKLLVALKGLSSRTAAGKTDIDCAFLRKHLPTRSLSEIQSVVELLKNKVLLNARLKLKRQRREERNVRKPIEEWTYMASSLVGTLEETISTAFSQPTTVAITSTSQSLSSSLNVPASCSATTLTSVPRSVLSTAASSAISSCSTPTTLPQSVSATAFHAKFGRTSKYATKDMFGVKCVVDFERIYGFLSTVQKPNQDCQLTPMESAIVLDLLMSLPEELPLLDCNKLHKHMIQVRPAAYTQPSSSCDQALKALKFSTTSSKLDYSNVTPPHLNPFIVPLTLLKRRQESIII